MCKYLVPYSNVTDENADMKDMHRLLFLFKVSRTFSSLWNLQNWPLWKEKHVLLIIFCINDFLASSNCLERKKFRYVTGQCNGDAAKLWVHKKRTFYTMTTLDHTVCFFKKYYVQKCKLSCAKSQVHNFVWFVHLKSQKLFFFWAYTRIF
jgi:hypothetical protein